MKKILILIIILILFILFIGCNEITEDKNFDANTTDSCFTLIASGSRITMFKENKTDVLYLIYKVGEGIGMTIMLDDDGLPLTYTNWIEK